MKKYVSFSELYSWHRDPKEYIQTYVEGVEKVANRGMTLGTICHNALENPNYRWEKALIEGGFEEKIPIFQTVLAKLAFKRLGNPEFSMRAKTNDGIELYAKLDDVDLKNWILNEYKTYESANPNSRESWYQKQVDGHKQLMFYGWILRLSRRRNYRQNWLHAIDLSRGTVQSFEAQFGKNDITSIEEWAMDIIGEIKKAGIWELRMSREDRVRKATPALFPEPAKEEA